MMQPIYDIPEICYHHGVRHAFVSPGSRCAPLTIAFAQYPTIELRSVSDERSAAFMALGLAQQSHRPVVLICTSGTASLNFYPAVAESFYQQIPLIVLTADRPVEWINQQDGQTINQQNIYEKHIKQSFQFLTDLTHADAQWHGNRVINQACLMCTEHPLGPVHINIPLREPFYPNQNDAIDPLPTSRKISRVSSSPTLTAEQMSTLEKEIRKHPKVLIIVGQNDNPTWATYLKSFTDQYHHAVVIGDITSNTHGLPSAIRHADSILEYAHNTDPLQPDLLITLGRSILSKNIKLFIRTHPPKEHWHVQSAGEVMDPLQHLSRIIRTTPEQFFSALSSSPTHPIKTTHYRRLWQDEEKKVHTFWQQLDRDNSLGELHIVYTFLKLMPKKGALFLANSMAVRYANLFGLPTTHQDITVYANRGTCGIDGCTSTAVGFALESPDPVFLITGDVAFFYDRNAFWHNYKMNNLRILLLNNHGGLIFDLVDGPDRFPDHASYFNSTQKLSAHALSQEHHFRYCLWDEATPREELDRLSDRIDKTTIFEFSSPKEKNKQTYKKYKKALHHFLLNYTTSI